MPTYNGNAQYIAIDGTDLSTKFNKVNLEQSVGSEETSAGSNLRHIQRSEKLLDHKLGMTLKFEAGSVPGYIQKLKPGTHTVTIGPEGSAPGSPKHQQDFILTSNQWETNVGKKAVYFEIKGEGADEPVTDMFDGGVF